MRSNTSIKERKPEMILELRKKGYAYRQIEKELGCSKGTISYHIGKGQKEKTKTRLNKTRPARRVSKREWMYQQKANKGCACGKCDPNIVVDPAALDYHHVDQKTKSFNLGDIGGRSIKLLQKEIDKCILIRADCHRIIESNARNDIYAQKRNTI